MLQEEINRFGLFFRRSSRYPEKIEFITMCPEWVCLPRECSRFLLNQISNGLQQNVRLLIPEFIVNRFEPINFDKRNPKTICFSEAVGDGFL